MKINRAFPIEKLFAAIEYYIETTNRRVTFEYIMLNEVNDGVEQALELAELLKNIKKLSYVNLIPYNPVSEHDQYSRSPKERVMALLWYLEKQGVNCVVRQEHGTDIDAAWPIAFKYHETGPGESDCSTSATLNKGWWIIQN